MKRSIARSILLFLVIVFCFFTFNLTLFAIVHNNSSFNSDYNNNTDLHIAVTNSQGIIVEFDRHGLRRHMPKDGNSQWEQSLVVESVPEAWYDFWDEILSKVCCGISSYLPENFSC
jgi:hypothetical protein